MVRGDDVLGHRALAFSALVIVLTICMPVIRRASPGKQLPICGQDQPATRTEKGKGARHSGAKVFDDGYELKGVAEDLRCFLSLVCGFCGMHLLHTIQQGFERRGAQQQRLENGEDADLSGAEGLENQDVKLCFSIGM